MTKTWTMNDTQKRFVEILKKHPEGITLFELKLEGVEFATGSINTLIKKGYVSTETEKQFPCDIMFNGKIVGHTTKSGKVYKLVKKDQLNGWEEGLSLLPKK